MFTFPPFKSGGSAFTAAEVYSGVEMVEPSHGHSASSEVAQVRNDCFLMALHPWVMQIFATAACDPEKGNFRAVAIQNTASVLEFVDAMAKTQVAAREFSPASLGQAWKIYMESPYLKALSAWPQAQKRVASITETLRGSGMLHYNLPGNVARVCVEKYTRMVKELEILVTLLKQEATKGIPHLRE